jgi:hypothetical protein
MKMLCMLPAVLIFAACGESPDSVSNRIDDDTTPAYQVIGQDLQQLKDDFNADHGRVRLVFLSGPTCGICLRGMADLNDVFLAGHQDDDRLVTFVVHVPTMGAKEKHAAESIPLLEGPRIHHYWEESGIIGQHYRDVMGVDMYVWDFWAIYGPDARWDDLLPPPPEYYEHQLGVSSGRFRTFPKERVLDAERFAEKTLALVENLDGHGFVAREVSGQNQAELLADGTEISYVGQPRNVAVRQHIMSRGGYSNLKRINSMRMSGKLTNGDRESGVTVTMGRPDELRRATDVAGILPAKFENLLIDNFEFDGLFVEWPDKGHKVSMQGMRKFGDVLAWKLELKQKNGPAWHMFVDSHSGDLVQKDALDDSGSVILSIRQSDFRDVEGFRLPHRVEYADGAGLVIAAETLVTISLDVDPFDVGDATVTH